MRGDLLILLTQLLDLLPDRVERARRVVAGSPEPLFGAHERGEPLLELVEGERGTLLRMLLLLFFQTLPLRSELLETRALDLDCARCVRKVLGALFPALAEVFHRAFGF